MWEAGDGARKQHSAASRSKLVSHNYDQTDDLHAWSIYRQNLNADLSECAIGVNKSSNTERPFGNFQLKEQTVNNILRHPKYGPRLKQDPYNYLRFGLPRAKAHLNGQPSTQSPGRHHPSTSDFHASNLVHSNHQRLNYDANEAKNLRKANSRHSLSSNEVEVASLNADHATTATADQVDRAHQRASQNESGNLAKLNGKAINGFNGRLAAANHLVRSSADHHLNRGDKRSSQSKYGLQNGGPHAGHHHSNYPQSSPKGRANLVDERGDSPNAASNHHRHVHEHSFTNQQPPPHHYLGNSFVDNAGPNAANQPNQPKFPHLIVRNLYFEIDRTSNSRRVCGAQRQKIRIIDNVSFEVRAGEMLAILATNGKFNFFFELFQTFGIFTGIFNN